MLGDAKRDPALAQHVLHRLAETEVDAERQRGEELGQPNSIDGLAHGIRGYGPYGVTVMVPRMLAWRLQ